MLRTILRFASAAGRVLVSASPLRVNSVDRLNVVSLLAQGAYALKQGNAKRAALLFGAASVAPKRRGLSYLVQGALTANDIRKKLF